MKFFIDTANIEEIKEANTWGILAGVTTNPSLIAGEKRDFHTTVREICALVDGPVSAEVISTGWEGMVKEAEVLAGLAPNVVVKIPMTVDGLKAVKVCKSKGIRTNVTLIFSTNQALLAANAGADYVSPFVGRLDDISEEGINLIAEIAGVFAQHGIGTKIIAASIRHPMHVTQAAKAGAHIATVPFRVLAQMVNHPLTAQGIKKFLADWEKAGG